MPDEETCALVLATLRSGGDPWSVGGDPRLARLVWTSTLRTELASALKPGCLVSRFLWSFALARKDEFYATLQGTQFPFLPQSFVIPRESEALRAALVGTSEPEAGEPPLWVQKPARNGGARKIRVMDSDEALAALSEPAKRPVIVQRYVPRLSLIDGRKFHLRIYALLLDGACGSPSSNKKVLIYCDGLAMVATDSFDPRSRSALVHVTNNRVQYADRRGAIPANWSIRSELREYVGARHGSGCFEALWSRIKSMLVAAILTVVDKWSGPEAPSAAVAAPHLRCFQLIGADVCVARDFTEPWLLELNTVPALYAGLDPDRQSDTESSICRALIHDLLTIVIAPVGSTPPLGGFEALDHASSWMPSAVPRGPEPCLACWGGVQRGICLASVAIGSALALARAIAGAGALEAPQAVGPEAACVSAELLVQHAADAIAAQLPSRAEPWRVLCLGASGSSVAEQLRGRLKEAEVGHGAGASLGSRLRQPWWDRCDCVVDDAVSDGRCGATSSRILKQRCCDIAGLLGCQSAHSGAGLYIAFSWTHDAQILGEHFDLVHAARLHSNGCRFWMHVGRVRAPALTDIGRLQPASDLKAALGGVAVPLADVPLAELVGMLSNPDSKYRWSSVAPPRRLGDHQKLDSVASEVGILRVHGVARKPSRRSRGLIFLDLHRPEGGPSSEAQVKCDAEWLPPEAMLLVSSVCDGAVLRVEGVIIRRLRGGDRANLLALNIWRIDR